MLVHKLPLHLSYRMVVSSVSNYKRALIISLEDRKDLIVVITICITMT